jgi:hypothetical protein
MTHQVVRRVSWICHVRSIGCALHITLCALIVDLVAAAG